MVNALPFQGRWQGFDPWAGAKNSHAFSGTAKIIIIINKYDMVEAKAVYLGGQFQNFKP